MDLSGDLTQFFEERLASLKCDPMTLAYIQGVFKRPCELDQTRAVIFELADARSSGDFERIQKLGDSIFWTRVFAPQNLRHATVEYYESAGAVAYLRCHVILGRRLKAYGELAERFSELARESRQLIIVKR